MAEIKKHAQAGNLASDSDLDEETKKKLRELGIKWYVSFGTNKRMRCLFIC